MTIDLTNMTPDMTRELNRVAEGYRKSYTEFIDRLSEIYGKDGFWWDTQLVSRNIYLCKCFENVCVLRLAKELIEAEAPDRLIVPNVELKRVLAANTNIPASHITVRTSDTSGPIKRLAKKSAFLRYLWMVELLLKRRWKVIWDCQQDDALPTLRGKELALVGTYRIPSEVKNGRLEDRYFSGLRENSDENVVFFSNFVYETAEEGARMIEALFHRPDTICCERYIRRGDFREMRRYARWCRRFKLKDAQFDGMDVSALVREAIRIGSWDENTAYGILSGRALCRIVEQYDLKVTKLIDWYEGQPSSNAMIRRFRAKYPDVPTVGYLVFPLEHYEIGLFPAKTQQDAKAVPEKYAVIGEIFREEYRKYAPDAEVFLAPALRFQKTFSERAELPTQEKAARSKRILVALSYFLDEAKTILSMLDACAAYLNDAGIEVLLKNHPVHEKYIVSDYGIDAVDFKYSFVGGDYYSAVKQVDLIIGASSTSSYETVLYGRPVVSVSMDGLCTTMMPRAWEGVHYGIVYNAADMEALIRKFLSEPYQRLDMSEPDRYAVPTNRETVNQFFERSGGR